MEGKSVLTAQTRRDNVTGEGLRVLQNSSMGLRILSKGLQACRVCGGGGEWGGCGGGGARGVNLLSTNLGGAVTDVQQKVANFVQTG